MSFIAECYNFKVVKIERFINPKYHFKHVDIATKTNSGLEQRIQLFEPQFNEDEIHATVERPKDEERMFQEHREKYAGSIHLPEWRKVLLVLHGLNPEINPRDL